MVRPAEATYSNNRITSAIESVALIDRRLATCCAEAVKNSFSTHQSRFDEVTRRARERFLRRDWAGGMADAADRLNFYNELLDGLTGEIEQLLAARVKERKLWAAIKEVYSTLIADSQMWEIAETFFNSVTRRVFATEGVDKTIEFVDTDFDAPPTSPSISTIKVFSGAALPDLLIDALTDSFEVELWSDLRGAVGRAAERIEAVQGDKIGRLELKMISSVFYRGRGAYLVGSIGPTNGPPLAIALCLRHADQDGITLDAVLHGDVDLAILFSYTRSYFRVDVECPYTLVRHLRQLMPRKRLIDLYNAIGFHRHGKTEFYRDFLSHLRQSRDRFVVAEGARGMVMAVFTLPSYDVVFKLIKDHFELPKESTRADVMRRYRLVFEHDRAGRLIEAHEFEHLRIERERFEPSLLNDLLREASSIVKIDDGDVVIGHAYVERRVRPLNIFFRECDPPAAAAAGRDYGQSIRDLAASNIFPGDLLTKNFGVTRHGRIVFYDYDELCFLTDCHFRVLPVATTPEQEMAAEPWFSVGANDIFPEEFMQFLTFPEAAREALLQHHGDIFQADFWRAMQRRIEAGELPELFPYPQERRLIIASRNDR